MDKIPDSLVTKVFNWLGKENVLWFRHLKNLKGSVNCVLKLNYKKKHTPVHPVHFREGMQVRNFLRRQIECENWTVHDYDDTWPLVVEKCIEKLQEVIPG